MGTNYYTNNPECSHWERIHLGKSSAGWAFNFQLNGGKFYKNIQEMREWLSDKKIWNEYGEEVTHEKFWQMVENKQATGNFEESSNPPDIIIDGYLFKDCEFS
jgi:hypothetical protein